VDESRFSRLARTRGAFAGLGSNVLSKKTLLAVTVGTSPVSTSWAITGTSSIFEKLGPSMGSLP